MYHFIKKNIDKLMSRYNSITEEIETEEIETEEIETEEIETEEIIIYIDDYHWAIKKRNEEITTLEPIDTFISSYLKDKLREKTDKKVELSIIVNNQNIFIKNISEGEELKDNLFFEDFLNRKLIANSYLVMIYKTFVEIVENFKGYEVEKIYDSSIINAFYLKSEYGTTNKTILYIDISLDFVTIVIINEKIHKRVIDLSLKAYKDKISSTLLYRKVNELKKIYYAIDNDGIESDVKKLIDEYNEKILKEIELTKKYFKYQNFDRIYLTGEELDGYEFFYEKLTQTYQPQKFLNTYKDTPLKSLNIIEKIDGITYFDLNDMDNKFFKKDKNDKIKYIRIQKVVKKEEDLTKKERKKIKTIPIDLEKGSDGLNDKIEINPENKVKKQKQRNLMITILFFTFVVIVLFSTLYFLFIPEKKGLLKKSIDNFKFELNTFTKIKDKQFIDIEENQHNNKSLYVTKIIVQIAKEMDQELRLSSISIDNDKQEIILSGNVIDGGESLKSTHIVKFKERLEDIKMFNRVKLLNFKQNMKQTTFSIKCEGGV